MRRWRDAHRCPHCTLRDIRTLSIRYYCGVCSSSSSIRRYGLVRGQWGKKETTTERAEALLLHTALCSRDLTNYGVSIGYTAVQWHTNE